MTASVLLLLGDAKEIMNLAAMLRISVKHIVQNHKAATLLTDASQCSRLSEIRKLHLIITFYN